MTLLDTHAVVWWIVEPERIPAKARKQIGATLKAGAPLSVSAVSAFEIARLAERKRLSLRMPADAWIAQLQTAPYFRFIPVDHELALRAATLSGFDHGDPADRMILATAQVLGAALVTADRRLREYKPVRTIWD